MPTMTRGVRAVVAVLAGLVLACIINAAPAWWIAGILGIAFGIFVWLVTAPRRPGDDGNEPAWRRWARRR
jgi:hypothetical protein